MLISVSPENRNPIACSHGVFHDKCNGIKIIDIVINRRVGSIELGTWLKIENYVFLGSYNDLRTVSLASTPSWHSA